MSRLDYALAYAEQGYAVLPLVPDNKTPLTPRGFYDATKDPAKIREWWNKTPNANIGIATGPVSGVIVVDVDVKNGVNGKDSLATLNMDTRTLTANTPTGGQHLYYLAPDISNDVLKCKIGLLPGIDLRADAGYVVAVGSAINGEVYQWLDPEAPVAALPKEFLALIRNNTPMNVPSQRIGATLNKGERNAALTSMAGVMRRRSMNADSIEAALLIENREQCNPALSEQEVRGIAHSVAKYKPGEAKINVTDAGNAQRLVNQYGEDLRYCHPWGKWLVWDSTRWKKDDMGAIVERAKATARAIYLEAASEQSEKQREALGKWARESERRAHLMDMIVLAQSEPGIPVTPVELDANKWLLNCRNGTIDLKTGKLLEHRREDNITKLAAADYDPKAKSELWDKFLQTVTGNDSEVMEFLQRAVGYSLSGETGEEKLFFIHGPAASGKSTFIEAIKAVMGEYSTTADFEAFLKRRDVGGPRNDIARLAGSRLVVSIEVDEGKRLAEGLVKMLTGGDTVAARFLHKEAFEFVPQFKLWLAANHEPKVNDDDSAMWRRILRVPFDHVIPEDQRDPAIKATLKNTGLTGAAILAWAVQGCLAWQQDGLKVPAKVKAATDEYRKEMDPLNEWLEAYCVLKSEACTPSEELLKSYSQWAQENNTKPVRGRGFAQRLKERGLVDGRRHGKRVWIGIELDSHAGGMTE